MDSGHCCGANDIFDMKRAIKDLKKYRHKGPGTSTAKLLNRIEPDRIINRTLLDIGGGIGAIQWHFLKNGAKMITDIDASNSFLKVATDYSKEKGWHEKSRFLFGDFVEIKQNIEPHDFVTLDKVICCYPDYQSLLEKATSHCKDTLALTFPIRNIISRFLIFLGGIYFSFRKNPFRTYLHPPEEISKNIRSYGFERVYAGLSFPWHVQIYRRIEFSSI